jgi:hypothetical protein
MVKINKFPLAALGAPDRLTVTSVRHRMGRDEGFRTEIEVRG